MSGRCLPLFCAKRWRGWLSTQVIFKLHSWPVVTVFVTDNGVFPKRNEVNSAKSENLINHWSMNQGQFKDSISYMCLAGAVVASWPLTQEVARWSPFYCNDKYFCHWIQGKYLRKNQMLYLFFPYCTLFSYVLKSRWKYSVVVPQFFSCRYVKQICFEVGDAMFEMTTNFSRAVTEYNKAYTKLIEHLHDYYSRWEKLSDTYYQ